MLSIGNLGHIDMPRASEVNTPKTQRQRKIFQRETRVSLTGGDPERQAEPTKIVVSDTQ